LDQYSTRGQSLPVPGGYDEQGHLTQDASAIMASRRVLPIGYWKGSGLSLLLDILAAVLSGGLSTQAITKQEAEHSLSQVFITLDLSRLSHFPGIAGTLDTIIHDYHSSIPESGKEVHYPGEHVNKIREANLKAGIPVSQKIWNEILSLR
jgi:3-dehydro-L-gulonate 2-dehydrogenase